MADKKVSVERIFKDFLGKLNGLAKALTTDHDDLYNKCAPAETDYCLYGLPNEAWAVRPPPVEVPTRFPEPVWGINNFRDDMSVDDWLLWVAGHSDAWLVGSAFSYAAITGLTAKDRKALSELICKLRTLCELVRDDIARRQSQETITTSSSTSITPESGQSQEETTMSSSSSTTSKSGKGRGRPKAKILTYTKVSLDTIEEHDEVPGASSGDQETDDGSGASSGEQETDDGSGASSGEQEMDDEPAAGASSGPGV